jgi:hypothetical protein
VTDYSRKIGSTTVDLSPNVASIQKAINSLPSDGGTVVVAPGEYSIDAVNASIKLRNGVRLVLTGVTLKVIPNSAIRYAVLDSNAAWDWEVVGGEIVGDRYEHSYVTAGLTTSQQTHEWGHGFAVHGGGRGTVTGLKVSNCTGDGICISSDDIVVENCVSTNNRRQGCSIVDGVAVKLLNSEFSYTNGTSPQCGVDIEPEPGQVCKSVLIDNCRFPGNAKYGINILQRSDGGIIDGVTVQHCQIGGTDLASINKSNGAVVNGASNVSFLNNQIGWNSATGLRLLSGKTLHVSGNRFGPNYTRNSIRDRNPDVTRAGYSSTFQADLLITTTSVSGLDVGTNSYV